MRTADAVADETAVANSAAVRIADADAECGCGMRNADVVVVAECG